jgi:hypothetical protein
MLSKKTILPVIILFFMCNCYAQDTIKKKNRLTASVVENFFVLKSDKQTKQGLYQAVYKRNIPLASGKYINNKRVGIWHFYDLNGTLVENFNYDGNLLLYEKPDDILSETKIQYGFDVDSIKNTDILTKPIKIGGRYFGYIPYLKIFKLSDDYIGTDPRLFMAILELLISPGGRLADFKVHIKSQDSERITTFSTDLFDLQDKIFAPATVNNKPVISRIFVRCRLTDVGELDVD